MFSLPIPKNNRVCLLQNKQFITSKIYKSFYLCPKLRVDDDRLEILNGM